LTPPARLALAAFGCSFLAFVGIAFVPWTASVSTDYYEYLHHLAVEYGWRFGTDVVSTYGPLGFLGLPFFRERTFGLMLAGNVVFLLFAVCFLFRFWTMFRRPGWPTAFWLGLVLLFSTIGAREEWAPLLSLPQLFVCVMLFAHFHSGRSEGRMFQLGLPIWLGSLVLVKWTVLPLAALAVLCIGIDEVVSLKRTPWKALAFVLAIPAFWILCGQDILDLPSCLRGARELSSGYLDGMSFPMHAGDEHVPFLFLAVVLCLLAIAARIGWRTLRYRSVLLLVPLLTALYGLFAHGFVRAGGGHTSVAILTLLSLIALLLPWLHANWPGRDGAGTVLGILLAGLVVLLGTALSGPHLRPRFELPGERCLGLCELLREGTRGLQAAEARRLGQVSPSRSGSAQSEKNDMPAGDPGFLLASGKAFRPRPTLVSYSAYTPYLSKANRTYLESPDGPSSVYFASDPIDDKYPTLADNYSFLSLASHFELRGSASAYLVFTRRPRSVPITMEALGSKEIVRFGETVIAPESGNDPLWLKVDVKYTLLGRLLKAVFRPPQFSIILDAQGTKATHRLISAMARDGFLASPYLADTRAFAKFYSAQGNVFEGLPRLSHFSIEPTEDGFWSHMFFSGEVAVEAIRVRGIGSL